MTTTSKWSGRDLLDAVRRQRLHAGEHVVPALRSFAADVGLAEGTVGEDLTVGALRLLQDLPAVSDEQQPTAGSAVAKPGVVQGCDDGLAGAGRGDDEVAVPIVDLRSASSASRICVLMRVRPDLEPGERVIVVPDGRWRERASASRSASAGLGVVWREGGVGPVAVEGGRRTCASGRVSRRRRAERSTPAHRPARTGTGSSCRQTRCRSRSSGGTARPSRAGGSSASRS